MTGRLAMSWSNSALSRSYDSWVSQVTWVSVILDHFLRVGAPGSVDKSCACNDHDSTTCVIPPAFTGERGRTVSYAAIHGPKGWNRVSGHSNTAEQVVPKICRATICTRGAKRLRSEEHTSELQ